MVKSLPEDSAALAFFTPRNERQREAIELFQRNDILLLTGSPGTGKTFLAVMLALQEVVKDPKKKKIYLTRPYVEAGEKMGFLPGKIDDKLAPFIQPIKEIISRSVHKDNIPSVKKLIENAPMGFLRGRNFVDCIAILDEAQNANESQLKLFLTRMGENCKLIISGDSLQTDIGRNCFLDQAVDMLSGIEGVGIVRFLPEDVVRHYLVTKILQAWEQKIPTETNR